MSAHGENKPHASVKLYWVFCFILCGITFIEWFVFKHREEWGISSKTMVPALMGLSLIKFAMVVGWYMHLRFDHNWLKFVFIASLAMGGATGIALAFLM